MAFSKKIPVKQAMTEASSILSDKKIFRRMAVFFLFLCFLLYGKSIGNKFAMDDEFVTYKNKQIHQGFKAIPEIFRTTYVIDEKNTGYEYRPLVKVSFAIEYGIFGENPAVSHFFNILLYFANALLLFIVLKRILQDHHIIFPFLVVVLFIVHPMHSEVVLSLKNRDQLLSFLGSFLALYYYLKYADKGQWKYMILGAFFLLFAILSKRDSITFWAIIPLAVYFFTTAPLRRIGLIFLVNIVPFLLNRLLVKSVINATNRDLVLFENPFFFGGTIWERIPLGFYCIWYYLKMFIFSHPLLAYYGYNQVPVPSWRNPFVIAMILLVIASGYYIFKKRKTKNIEVFAMLYFWITISMFLNIALPVVGIVAERFVYIPSVGLCILAVWGLFKLFKVNSLERTVKWANINSKVFLVLGIASLVFSVQVISRNAAWKDHYTLYKTDVERAPESAHLHTLLASASIQRSKETKSADQKRKYIGDALKHYKESIRIIPDYISSHNNVGMIYYSYYNNPKEAIPYLKRAVELDPNYVEAYFNLATSEAALGNLEIGEKYYLKTLELDSAFINAYYSLSAVYAKQEKMDKILTINQKAIDMGLKSDVFYVSIGNVYFMKGDTLKSLPYLEKGIELNPNNRFLNSFLAEYYKNKGNLEKANRYYDLMGKSNK